MGRDETRPRTHKRRSMYKGQKGGQKAPIRAQFRQKSEKKSKKAPDSALPILTSRPSNPLGAGARPDLPSKIGRNPPKSTPNRPPTYRLCAICPTGRERPCPPEPRRRWERAARRRAARFYAEAEADDDVRALNARGHPDDRASSNPFYRRLCAAMTHMCPFSPCRCTEGCLECSSLSR